MSFSPMELAEVFIKTGELADALDALNQHIATNTQDNKARRLRADVRLRMGKPDDLQLAIQDIEALSEKSANDYIQLSIIHERLGDIPTTIEAIQLALQLSPENERMIERLIEIFTQHQQYNEALEQLDKAPQTWRWLMRKANVHAINQQPDQALQAYNQAEEHLLTMFPQLLAPVSRNTMAQIHAARGQIYMTLEQYQRAEEDFKNALYYIPDDASIQFNLGLVLALTDRLDSAVKQCQTALNYAPSFIRQTLIDVLEQDNQYTVLKQRLNLDTTS